MKFQSKYPDVEAIRWNGTNVAEVLAFDERLKNDTNCFWTLESPGVFFVLLRGNYIVRKHDGQLIRMSQELFEETYEPKKEK